MFKMLNNNILFFKYWENYRYCLSRVSAGREILSLKSHKTSTQAIFGALFS